MSNDIIPIPVGVYDFHGDTGKFALGGGHIIVLFYIMKKLPQTEILSYKKNFSFANLFSAWLEFKNGKRHKQDVAEFSQNLIHNLSVLREDLFSGRYAHGGYFHFRISDPKPRDIHKASVRDRVVHHAVYRALYPHFDSKFIYDSYSCRINKGTHKAINRLREFCRKVSKNNTKTCWVLKCDIKKFFANIDHEILKNILEKYIKDKNTLWLLSQIIDSFSSQKQIYAIADICKKGLPLGNLTSQLLVNINMNEFDQFMKRDLKVKYYLRYADDFIILSENKNYLCNLLQYIVVNLKDKLKLELHPDKVYIKTLPSGVDFLGWVHFPKHKVLRTSTKRRMLRSLKHNLKEETVNSYRGLLVHGDTYKIRKKLNIT